MSVYLIRHGETEWSRNGRHTGTTDLPLTEHGVAQAISVAHLLDGHAFSLVLSSPMSRAIETAKLVGYAADLRTSDDLREWDYGAYEGVTTATIRESEPGWLLWRDGCPGGETADEVGVRVDRVIADARATDGDTLVFGHGHCLRVLTARWLGLPPRDGCLFALDTATISILGYEREIPVLSAWNVPGRDANAL